ncbi:hypothetical protein WIV_gp050 [Wiseana iridescent virus]|uniref:Uncharacterized protein n=1 Tax=Wiseana iridescent virus TaxID=68347 RepID=G0T576_IRV9|nr:hypothetical protein WIV_gp050 [Wiseana iridescent virus]ADO00393.1 hypothetical protein [Wiseana iridescent virus]
MTTHCELEKIIEGIVKDLGQWLLTEKQVPENTTISKWNKLTKMNIKKIGTFRRKECVHVFLNGNRLGEKCQTKPQKGFLCSPHKKFEYSDCNSQKSKELWKNFVFQTLNDLTYFDGFDNLKDEDSFTSEESDNSSSESEDEENFNSEDEPYLKWLENLDTLDYDNNPVK